MPVESTMLPLGTAAPNFHLPDVVSGREVSLENFAGKKALLVAFISVHCPFVKHIKAELSRIGQDYQPAGVGILAISANDVTTNPGDGAEHLQAMARETGFTFPVAYDESQETARAYRAACTPDLFLFDGDRKLVYRGQLDDSRPGNDKPVTGRDLRAALEAVLAGQPVSAEQKPSIGCNIKWRAGSAPPYFAS